MRGEGVVVGRGGGGEGWGEGVGPGAGVRQWPSSSPHAFMPLCLSVLPLLLSTMPSCLRMLLHHDPMHSCTPPPRLPPPLLLQRLSTCPHWRRRASG